MPRKGPAPKRPIEIDPVYGARWSPSSSTRSAGRQEAGRRAHRAHGARRPRDKPGTDPVVTLKRALDNVKPTLEVAARRVGGATYQVPVEVRATRARPWPCAGWSATSQARREKTMSERLMNELLDASNGLGAAVKRREDTHKMAESNKAFAHYRW